METIILIILLACSASAQHPLQEWIDQFKCTERGIADLPACRELMSNPILNRTLFQLEHSSGPEALDQQSIDDCPTMDRAYLAHHTRAGERSLSPYVMRFTYNRFRIPTYIYEASRLCTNCISTTTGRQEFIADSVPIKTAIEVYMRNGRGQIYKTEELVTVGFTCATPRAFSK